MRVCVCLRWNSQLLFSTIYDLWVYKKINHNNNLELLYFVSRRKTEWNGLFTICFDFTIRELVERSRRRQGAFIYLGLA